MNFDIYIDGFIGQSDFFSEGFSAKTLRDKLASAPVGTDELTIHINSGGGSVIEGFAIYDLLKTLPEVGMQREMKVNTVVEGLCGSIATIVAQSNSNGGVRRITKNSTYFIHNPYWTPDAPVPMEASELEALAESLKANEDKIAQFYADKTGKKLEVIKEKMDSTEEFTADEAKTFGFVDEVIGEAKAFQKHIINAGGKEYRFAAFYQPQKQNIMADIAKMFSDFENRIKGYLKSGIRNTMAQTAEGVKIFYDGTLAQGTPCFSDEAMTTPVADGAYTIENKKYTITGGKVSAIEDVAAAADTTALKAENETLKATVAEKETALGASKTESDKLKAELAEAKGSIKRVADEFVAFKAQFITGTGELKAEFQHFKGDEQPVKTERQKALNKIGNKLAEQLS